MKSFKVSKGPSAPPPARRLPDNLLSEDTVEILLGLCEGTIDSLENGRQSFFLGNTPLQNPDGSDNFQDFELQLFKGSPAGEPVTFDQGGSSTNNAVNVPITKLGGSVSRSTAPGQSFDNVEIRIRVDALYKTNDTGDLLDNELLFKIEYQKTGDPGWTSLLSNVARQRDNGDGSVNYQGLPAYGTEIGNSGSLTSQQRTDFANDVNGPFPFALGPSVATYDGSQRVFGQATASTIKEIRFPVTPPVGNEVYTFRVTKLSSDSTTKEFTDFTWESFQLVTSGTVTHPELAMVKVLARASKQFTSIPKIWGIYKAQEVLIPSVYDPITRNYDLSGAWDGSMVLANTNNPAWVIYDLINNNSSGLSAISNVVWDKYEAFELSKWYDNIDPNTGNFIGVPDGKGGIQPRYTLNVVIANPEVSNALLNRIGGAVNTRVFEDGNGVYHAKADQPGVTARVFGVEDCLAGEEFIYSATDVNLRYNDISVSFLNKDLLYKPDRRLLQDTASITAVGKISLNFPAIGCTDVQEAIRRATYRKIVSQNETTTVSFTTTRKGMYVEPFDLIEVADSKRNYGLSRRVVSIDGTRKIVTLRSSDSINLTQGNSYSISVGTGVYYPLTVVAQTGPVTQLTTVSALPAGLPGNFSIYLKGGEYGSPKQFRLVGISLNDNAPETVNLTALEVYANKWTETDAAVFQAGNTNGQFPGDLPTPVSNVTALQVSPSRTTSEGVVADVQLAWSSAGDATDYVITYSKDSESITELGSTKEKAFLFKDAIPGSYKFFVGARNAAGDVAPIRRVLLTVTLPTDILPTISTSTRYRTDDLLISWDIDVTTNPWRGGTAGVVHPDFSSFKLEIIDPSNVILQTYSGLPWETRSKVIDYNTLRTITGTDIRNFQTKVTFVPISGANPTTGTVPVIKTAPIDPGTVVSTSIGQLFMEYPDPTDSDFIGAIVWASVNPGVSEIPANEVWRGAGNPVINLTPGTKYYYKYAFFDVLGDKALSVSSESSITIAGLPTELISPSVPLSINASASGDCLFKANTFTNNVANPGELWVHDQAHTVNDTGNVPYFNHPSLGKQTIAPSGLATSYEAADASHTPPGEVAYVMWSVTKPSLRWSGYDATSGDHPNLTAVEYDVLTDTWQAVDNLNARFTFTPLDTDILLAIIGKKITSTQIDYVTTLVGSETPLAIRTTTVESGLTNVQTKATNNSLITMPTDFQRDGELWTSSISGNPATIGDLTSRWDFPSLTGVGKMARVLDLVTASFDYLMPKKVIKPIVGHTYKIEWEYRRVGVVSGTNAIKLWWRRLDENYLLVATSSVFAFPVPADGVWTKSSSNYTAVEGDAYLRPGGYRMAEMVGAGEFQLRSVDITDSTAVDFAQATADGKIVTFTQGTAPIGGSVGDLWFNTADKNKLFRFDGTTWQPARDTDIAQAISDASGAQTTANSRITTFFQGTTPTANATGDLWVDTSNGNLLKRWNGSAWTSARDSGIQQAIDAAANSQSAADGKIVTFFVPTAPASGMSTGDLWFDTDASNKLYRFDGTSWLVAQDAGIGAAALAAQNAQSTADGKIVTFFQGNTPTGQAIGDLWVNTSDKNGLKRWDGTAWVDVRDVSLTDAINDIGLTVDAPDPAGSLYARATSLFNASTGVGSGATSIVRFGTDANGVMSSAWLTSIANPQGIGQSVIGFAADMLQMWDGATTKKLFELDATTNQLRLNKLNVILDGSVIATNTIEGSSLKATSDLSVGSGATLAGGFIDKIILSGSGGTNNPVRITVGANTPTQEAPFSVNQNGAVTAKSITITTPGGSPWFNSSGGFTDAARQQLLQGTGSTVSQLSSIVNSPSIVQDFTLSSAADIDFGTEVDINSLVLTQSYTTLDPTPTPQWPTTITLLVEYSADGGTTWIQAVTKTYTKNGGVNPVTVTQTIQLPGDLGGNDFGGNVFHTPGYLTEHPDGVTPVKIDVNTASPVHLIAGSYKARATLSHTGDAGNLLNFNNLDRTLNCTASTGGFTLSGSNPIGSAGATAGTLTALTDTPDTLIGSEDSLAVVNSSGSSVEFVKASAIRNKINVRDYGVSPLNPAATNDANLASLFALMSNPIANVYAAPGSRGYVYSPAGQYEFSATAKQPDNVYLLGDGQNATIWNWASGIAIGVEWTPGSGNNTFDSGGGIRNIGLRCGTHIVGSKAIYAHTPDSGTMYYNESRYNVADVSIFGVGAGNYWDSGIHYRNMSYDYIRDVRYLGSIGDVTHGTPVYFAGDAIILETQTTLDDVVHGQSFENTIQHITANFCDTGIKIRGFVEGVHISHCNLVGVRYGLDARAPANSLQPLIHFHDNHVNAVYQDVHLENYSQTTILGNHLSHLDDVAFNASDWTGVFIFSGVGLLTRDIIISQNHVMAQTASSAKTGLLRAVLVDVPTVMCLGNIIYGTDDPVTYKTLDYGIQLGSNATDCYIGNDNKFRGSITTKIQDINGSNTNTYSHLTAQPSSSAFGGALKLKSGSSFVGEWNLQPINNDLNLTSNTGVFRASFFGSGSTVFYDEIGQSRFSIGTNSLGSFSFLDGSGNNLIDLSPSAFSYKGNTVWHDGNLVDPMHLSGTETITGVKNFTGNLGVNTSNPLKPLHVSGQTRITGGAFSDTTSYVGVQYFTNLLIETTSGRSGIVISNQNDFLSADHAAFALVNPFDSAGEDNFNLLISRTGVTPTDKCFIKASGRADFSSLSIASDPVVTRGAAETITGAKTFTAPITNNSTSTRDKIRVWGGSPYSIGMGSAYTYGDLNDFAMTFQMSNTANRGFWWGDSAHTNAQGAMSLTTDGRLTVDKSLRFASSYILGPDSAGVFTIGIGTALNNDPCFRADVNAISIINRPLFLGLNNGVGGDIQWQAPIGGTATFYQRQALDGQMILMNFDSTRGTFENNLIANRDGGVSLYYNNILRLHTIASGVQTEGQHHATESNWGGYKALTDGATINIDLQLANVYDVTLAGNRTLANPTNMSAGRAGTIAVRQDAIGGRTLAFGSQYKWAGGAGAPTLTTTANAIDIIRYVVVSSTELICTFN